MTLLLTRSIILSVIVHAIAVAMLIFSLEFSPEPIQAVMPAGQIMDATTVDAKQRSATGSGTEGHNTHRNDIWTISRTIFRWTLPRAYANASNATSNESSATGSSPRGRGHTRESETLAPSSYSRTTTNLCRHNGQATACSVNRASWSGALLCRGPAARTRTAAPRQGRFAQITSSWASH